MHTPTICSSFRKSLALTTNVHALCHSCSTVLPHTSTLNTINSASPIISLFIRTHETCDFSFVNFYCNLLLLRGRHQRHCPAHKSRNLACVVWLILTMQYQQKLSKVSAQLDVGHRATIIKPFNVGEVVLYVIYGTRVVVSWCDTALNFTLCCISHSTTLHVP